jgi:lysophospholipase L1-like esterase
MMRRRDLFGSAAAAALFCRSAWAQLANQPLSRAQLAERQIWKTVPVTRTRSLADGLNYVTSGSGQNTQNTRQSCWSPRDVAITDIVLEVPGFYEAVPEANFTTSFTVTASVEYPVGTFTVVRFAGSTTGTVTAGYTALQSDPTPIYIPANTQFFVKMFLSWTGGVVNFPWLSYGNDSVVGEWTQAGIGLSDQTQTTTVLGSVANFPTSQIGFACGVKGRLASPLPIIGIIGDSISQGTGDAPDPVYGGVSIERAFRNVLPVYNMARQSETFANYLSRPSGRSLLTRDACTHLFVNYGRNDITAAVAAATIEANLQSAIQPFLARGIKVYTATITPLTTSSDNWATTGNQSLPGNANNSIRATYNAWLRANWQAIGLSGLFDFGAIVDPGDTGKWSVDGTAGYHGVGVATLSANAIASVALPTYNGGSYGGAGYPVSQSALSCVVYPYPDDPIQSGGGVVTCATNSSGVPTSYSKVSGGSYTIPPLISPAGQWTYDGTHPSRRGYNEMIYRSGLSSSLMTF